MVVYFHLEDHDRLGYGFGFGGFGWRSRFLGDWLGSRGVVVSEGVEVVIFLFLLLLLLLLLVLLVLLVLAGPGLDNNGGEVADEEVPVVKVGVGCSIGEF